MLIQCAVLRVCTFVLYFLAVCMVAEAEPRLGSVLESMGLESGTQGSLHFSTSC